MILFTGNSIAINKGMKFVPFNFDLDGYTDALVLPELKLKDIGLFVYNNKQTIQYKKLDWPINIDDITYRKFSILISWDDIFDTISNGSLVFYIEFINGTVYTACKSFYIEEPKHKVEIPVHNDETQNILKAIEESIKLDITNTIADLKNNIDTKADISALREKVDRSLWDTKADTSDMIKKVDKASWDAKADVSAIDHKANKDDVYTKSEVDMKLWLPYSSYKVFCNPNLFACKLNMFFTIKIYVDVVELHLY